MTKAWNGKLNRASIVAIVVVCLPIAIFLLRVGWMDHGRYAVYDDAFISFRYARNLAGGNGLVFNPGERVEGYTNFLWTVMLAGAIRSGVDPIVAAKVLGILCGVLLLLVTWKLAGTLFPKGGPWLVAPALILSLTASLPRFALSGLEVLMFALWLCLALWLELAAPEPWAGILAAVSLALAALTRPEGLPIFFVIVAACSIERVWRGEKPAPVIRGVVIRLIAFGVIFLPYFAWRYGYYGYPFPNTFYDKAGGLNIAALGRGLLYLRNELLLINLPLCLWGVCVLRSIKQRGVPTILAALIAYLLYLVAIGGDDWAVFGPRFLVVIFPWMAVLGLVGLTGFSPRRRLVQATFAAAVLILVGGLSLFEAAAYRTVMDTMNRGWWSAAEWLSGNASKQDLVAVGAAGIIPYHTGLPTLDMYGLNDLHIAHLTVARLGSGLAGHEKFDPVYILEKRPEYIATWINPEGQPISAGLEQIPDRLKDEYALVAVFLMRAPAPGEPTWLDVSTTAYTEDNFGDGYIFGVFQRRTTKNS
jgi:arabinofuranosyltransferase